MLNKTNLDALAANPEFLVEQSPDELFGLSRGSYQCLQMAALKNRFKQLRNKVAALTKLADSLAVHEVTSLEAGAPLLFQHVIYKSYPLAFIERSDFVRLTNWLKGLTTHDLTHLDVSRIELIDDWLQYLDDNSPLRVVHSTGTSGKLSFLPRSTTELPTYIKGLSRFYHRFGNEPDRTLKPGLAMVIPHYRHGFNAGPRIVQAIMDGLKVPEEDCIALYDFVSADLMSLAGRLRTAEAKGEGGKLSMNPRMGALRDRLLQQRANEKEAFPRFFDHAIERFRGRQVLIICTIPQLYKAAAAAKGKGITRAFSSSSIVHTGGGLKGESLPPDFMRTICEFVGVDGIRELYGMTEFMTMMGKCPKGHFHVPPQLIPYLVDPDTGDLLPQSGIRSGRFGFFDLLAQTYWGGFLTGDYLTLDWDIECKCGRTGGPVIYGSIERLSEKRGGDDKISCSGGADEAHEKAVEFLLQDQG